MLSILIPLRDEYENLDQIERYFTKELNNIEHEIILINDYSSDNTLSKIKEISQRNNNFVYLDNKKKGLGGAISYGIERSRGHYICIMMADFSDSTDDLKKYYKLIKDEKVDAVFGSRFLVGSNITNYPFKKYILNRIFNFFVSVIFFNSFNDYTNAFKIYRTTSIKKLKPIVSENFNVFLEIPLKVISRKMNYETTSISWTGREKGISKFKIKELQSKYLFTLLYCLLEKILIK